MPRRTIAVVCAVRQRDERDQGDGEDGDNAAGETPAQDQANRGSLRNPAQRRQARRRSGALTAVTMPNVVGRRWVLTRRSDLPPPCSSTSARTSSHAQRPTKTLTSRSSDQPSSISIVRTARDRRSQSVSWASTRSADVQVSLQKRSSVTLPGHQQQRAPRLGKRRPRRRGWSAARPAAAPPRAATARRGSARAGARAAGGSADTRPCRGTRACRPLQRVDVRSQRVGDVLRDRDGEPDDPAAEQERRRPPVLPGRDDGEAGQRQDERDHLPPDRVRQERERVDVRAVDRRERRRAPDAGVDARAPQRTDEGQRTVDASAPQHVAVEELLRVMRHQPGFALAVADLLRPVRLDRDRWWCQTSAAAAKPIFQPRACSRQQTSTSSPARR